MKRVAIIGGGISGLTLAYFLQKKSPSLRITLFEEAPVLGGKIQTRTEDGLTIECGADSMLMKEGAPIERLVRELEIEQELISPSEKNFAIQRNGKLHSIPLGMLQGFPKNFLSLWQCSLFSPWGKLVASVRPILSQASSAPEERGDPSIAEALRFRYGSEVSRYLFETVFGGIHSGDASRLSFRALYPDMERGAKGKYSRARFVSFKNGMETLPNSVASQLKDVSVVHERVMSVEKKESGFLLRAEESADEFDSVAISTPAYVASALVSQMSLRLSSELQTISHSSSAVITFVLGRESVVRAPVGSGYLLAHGEPGVVTGCTYSSMKWRGRAPEEKLIVRIFFGRNGGVRGVSDEELKFVAEKEIRSKLDFRAPDPERAYVQRWESGLPQYEIGHLAKVERIHASLRSIPGLFLTGTSYRGVGIPDCVRQSWEAAQSVNSFCDSIEEKEIARYGTSVCS